MKQARFKLFNIRILACLEKRSQCLPYSKVATGTIFKAFGMARPGFEPTTSRSRSGCSTTEPAGPVIESQGHFLTIYFPGYVCFVLY